MSDDKSKKPLELSFPLISDVLDPLIEAMGNLLDREFPKKLAPISGLQPFLLLALCTANNTYRAIRYLGADYPSDPNRKLEFGLAISPLARVLSDILFTIMFMSEDLPPRVDWYHRGGWRELKEDYDRHRSEYGELPEWKIWFNEYEDLLERQRKTFGISEEEAANPKKPRYWPIPGRMSKHKDLSPEGQKFLQYLNDWIYRELSADSHVSAAGMMRHHGQLLREKGEEKQKILSKLKSNSFLTAITLIIAICTEINDICHYGREEKLSYLWRILVEY